MFKVIFTDKGRAIQNADYIIGQYELLLYQGTLEECKEYLRSFKPSRP